MLTAKQNQTIQDLKKIGNLPLVLQQFMKKKLN